MRKKSIASSVPTLPPPVADQEVGYARVSTNDQSPEFQIEALKKRGIPEKYIFVDIGSGKNLKRAKLGLALKFLKSRPGWTLVVWKLDRLGRDVSGLVQLSQFFKEEGINLVSLTENIDTRSPIGMFYFHLLSCLAQLERDMTVERTRAAMVVKKEKGMHLGRKTRLSPTAFSDIEHRLLEGGETAEQIAVRYKISKHTVNYWFPGWRVKTAAERRVFRKDVRPFPKVWDEKQKPYRRRPKEER